MVSFRDQSVQVRRQLRTLTNLQKEHIQKPFSPGMETTGLLYPLLDYFPLIVVAMAMNNLKAYLNLGITMGEPTIT
jgi:hypothetical protein